MSRVSFAGLRPPLSPHQCLLNTPGQNTPGCPRSSKDITVGRRYRFDCQYPCSDGTCQHAIHTDVGPEVTQYIASTKVMSQKQHLLVVIHSTGIGQRCIIFAIGKNQLCVGTNGDGVIRMVQKTSSYVPLEILHTCAIATTASCRVIQELHDLLKFQSDIHLRYLALTLIAVNQVIS